MTRNFLPLTLFLALFLFLGAAQETEKSYSAGRFDVNVVVQEGGSLLVTETVTFHFVGGPFTFVFRELPTDLTDGIDIISARMDGRIWPMGGTAAGLIEITDRDPIRVTWHLPSTTDATHTFTLVYQVAGVVRPEENHDLLRWQALPDDYDYAIGESRVTFTYPAAATLIAPPHVRAGEAAVTQANGQVIFSAQGLEADDPLVVELRFAPGSLVEAPPQWQQRQMAQNRYGPAWLVAAGGLFIVGLFGVLTYANADRPRRATFTTSDPVYEPPDDLPPAVAGALDSGANPTWANALATLFDLAKRGVLSIEESGEKKWYRSRDFVLQLDRDELGRAEPAGLRPHERSLVSLLFETKKGPQATVKLSQLNSLVTSSRWKVFAEALKDELKTGRFIDEAHLQRRRSVNVMAVLLLFLAAAGFLAALLLGSFFGFWPLALAGSLFLLGLGAFIVAATISPLSDAGAVAAGQWQAFSRYLKDVSRGRAAATRPDVFELFLPYAAAFGLLHAWARHFHKASWTDVPLWFHPLATAGDDHMAAFVAMSSAVSSSGGDATGAGAAGGGSSGAG